MDIFILTRATNKLRQHLNKPALEDVEQILRSLVEWTEIIDRKWRSALQVSKAFIFTFTNKTLVHESNVQPIGVEEHKISSDVMTGWVFGNAILPYLGLLYTSVPASISVALRLHYNTLYHICIDTRIVSILEQEYQNIDQKASKNVNLTPVFS